MFITCIYLLLLCSPRLLGTLGRIHLLRSIGDCPNCTVLNFFHPVMPLRSSLIRSHQCRGSLPGIAKIRDKHFSSLTSSFQLLTATTYLASMRTGKRRLLNTKGLQKAHSTVHSVSHHTKAQTHTHYTPTLSTPSPTAIPHIHTKSMPHPPQYKEEAKRAE